MGHEEAHFVALWRLSAPSVGRSEATWGSSFQAGPAASRSSAALTAIA